MANVVRVTRDTWGVFGEGRSASTVLAAVVVTEAGGVWAVYRVSPVDGRIAARTLVADGFLSAGAAEREAEREAARLSEPEA